MQGNAVGAKATMLRMIDKVPVLMKFPFSREAGQLKTVIGAVKETQKE